MIYLKKLVIGQTVQRMIGYVRKDRNLTTFRNRNKGITPEMIALGIAEHESLKMSYLDNKILVTKANLFNKAYVKWYSEYAPAKLSFSQIMCNLLNDNKHVLSSTLFMNSSGQMRRSAAEVYWNLLMGKEVTEYEVRHMLYLPKNAFGGPEYVPTELPEREHEPLFGDDDEEQVDEANGAGPSSLS